MRGMTRYYHERFFSDVRHTTLVVMALIVVGWWGVPEAFLLVPVAALIGANQTAFDASYLHFSRHYASTLENELNKSVRRDVLVASKLEDRYLYPLNSPKLVTARLGGDFTWFGWKTLFYTATGMMTFIAGLLLGWSTLIGVGAGWVIFYVVSLGTLTVASLGVGGWWFVAGEGERRLREILDSEFAQAAPNDGSRRRP